MGRADPARSSIRLQGPTRVRALPIPQSIDLRRIEHDLRACCAHEINRRIERRGPTGLTQPSDGGHGASRIPQSATYQHATPLRAMALDRFSRARQSIARRHDEVEHWHGGVAGTVDATRQLRTHVDHRIEMP